MAVPVQGDAMKKVIKSFLKEHINTSTICEIVSVSKLQSNQVIDIKPVIKTNYGSGVFLEKAILRDVPIIFPSGGGGILSFPVKVGDQVVVHFSQESIEEWFNATRLPVEPLQLRSFDINDGVAVPCLYNAMMTLHPHPDNVELRFDPADSSFKMFPDGTIITANAEASYTMGSDGSISITNSQESVTMSGSGDIEITNGSGSITMSSDGTINLNGVIISPTGQIQTALGVDLDTHLHSGVTPGTSNSGPPVSA